VRALGALEAENLTLERGGRALFRGLSFRVNAGEVLAIEGPNGAGKTSLLRLIAGFLQEESGTIAITGRDGARISDAEERESFVGWLGHQDGIKPQLTPAETLFFYARYYGTPGDIAAALDEVGLGPARDLPAQYLSAGQRKRLALARLKLCARPIWLLDEPLAALDADGKILAAAFMKEHCRVGGIAIAATHEALGIDCQHLALGASR
jgi:heme exporter protein A